MAYLGDIALDEEDMRMFKVDRIVNLAQRTVTILNHTDTGKCVCMCEFECLDVFECMGMVYINFVSGLIGTQELRKRT